MAEPSYDGSYEQYVVVAEEQYKIFPAALCQCNSCPELAHAPYSTFSMYFAGFEWKCTFEPLNFIDLKLRGFAQGRLTEMHLEILLCDEDFKLLPGFPMRQLLTADDNVWYHRFGYNEGDHHCPDFTLKDVQIGGRKSTGKLRVGDQVFHVNKDLLSTFSPYFNALFNGNFDEAKQDEIELKGKTELENPALFHDFLMMISLPGKHLQNALPNAKNVAALLALAQFYQVDLVRDKCERHLKFCREMAAAERLLLAKKYGLQEVQFHIVQEMSTLKDCQQLFYASLGADS